MALAAPFAGDDGPLVIDTARERSLFASPCWRLFSDRVPPLRCCR